MNPTLDRRTVIEGQLLAGGGDPHRYFGSDFSNFDAGLFRLPRK